MPIKFKLLFQLIFKELVPNGPATLSNWPFPREHSNYSPVFAQGALGQNVILPTPPPISNLCLITLLKSYPDASIFVSFSPPSQFQIRHDLFLHCALSIINTFENPRCAYHLVTASPLALHPPQSRAQVCIVLATILDKAFWLNEGKKNPYRWSIKDVQIFWRKESFPTKRSRWKLLASI